MLTYLAAGVTAGALGLLSGQAGWRLLRRRGSSQHQNPMTALEERVIGTIVPAMENAARDSAALTEQVRQFEARSTSFQTAVVTQLGQMVTRDEVAEAMREVVTRTELELALQSAAQQILRVAQSNAPSGNGSGRALSALQEQVAGISQQLGLS